MPTDERLGPIRAGDLYNQTHTEYAVRCPDGKVIGNSLNPAIMTDLAAWADTAHSVQCEAAHAVVTREVTAWAPVLSVPSAVAS